MMAGTEFHGEKRPKHRLGEMSDNKILCESHHARAGLALLVPRNK
jgi:hypothetical protein